MRWLTLLLLLLPAVALGAGPGTEQRCTDLDTVCVCSEPLDNADNPADWYNWDPSDSPNGTECSSDWLGSSHEPQQTVWSQPEEDLDYGGTDPPTNVLRKGPADGFVAGLQTGYSHSAPPSDGRLCTRYYMRVQNGFKGVGGTGCDNQNVKMWEICHGGSNCWQVTENRSGDCVSPPYRNFIINQDVLTNNANFEFDDTLQWSECEKDESGNGGWCRFEYCIGGDLTGTGEKTFTARITSLDSGLEQEESITPGTGPALSQFRYNMDLSHADDNEYELAYFMTALWPTDSGQWIGAASEIEGTGTLTGGSLTGGSIQ